MILIFPWTIRRLIYRKFFNYKLDSASYIGLSWIYPNELILGKNSSIGSLTVCKNIDRVQLGNDCSIGSLNWITGFPSNLKHTGHFAKEANRIPALIMKDHSAITSRHLIDCTNTIIIGEYTTIAGIRSQILTHSINIHGACQESNEITIGKYCFIGTASVILKGSIIPDYSVVGAMSLVNKKFEESYCLYGGVPARKIKPMQKNCAYYERNEGYIL
jgi:acetyltransferase-like isoleucine patch superfamily enzyme